MNHYANLRYSNLKYFKNMNFFKCLTIDDENIIIRIHATNKMISGLSDKNYTHFFFDGTFDCVPSGRIFEQFIVCIGYNETKDYFSPVFYALTNKKSESSYKVLHELIKLLNPEFNPLIWTLDFDLAHINVKKKY